LSRWKSEVDWEGAKYIGWESVWRIRGIIEVIWIGKIKDNMIRVEGQY